MNKTRFKSSQHSINEELTKKPSSTKGGSSVMQWFNMDNILSQLIPAWFQNLGSAHKPNELGFEQRKLSKNIPTKLNF